MRMLLYLIYKRLFYKFSLDMFEILILLVLYSRIVHMASIVLSNDLTSQTFTTTSGLSILQIIGWNLIEAQNPISQCSNGLNQVSVFGQQSFGLNTVIYKTLELQSHYSITLDFQLWIIDYYQEYEYKTYVDDQLLGMVTGSQIIYSQDLCGNTQLDGFGSFTFTVNHVSSLATIIITSNQDQPATITSWGFRDVQLSINICPIGCVYCLDEVSQCTMWIVDLQFWTNLVFSSQEGWSIMSSNFATIDCLGQNFIKIYQIGDTLSDTISIKPYYQLQVQFKLLKAGNYNSERIILTINSIIKFQQIFNQELYLTQCSGQSNERDILISQTLSYQYSDFNSNQLNFEFSSDIQATTRFWGIRDFYLFISPCIDNCLLCTDSLDCQSCDTGYTFDGINCFKDIPEPPSPYVWTNYYTQFTDQLFTNKLEFNFTSNQNGLTITQCNGYSLLGGYQVGGSISANISSLPFHNRLRVRVTVYAIDQWYTDNPLQMSIDGMILNIVTRDKFAANQQNLCGNSQWGDNIYQIDYNLDHLLNYTILSFKFLNQLSNQNFGIREIMVDYYYCGPQYKCGTCDSAENCLTCSDPQRVLANGCNCPTYETNNQQCPECDTYNTIANCYLINKLYYCDAITYTTFCKTCLSTHTYNGSMCLFNDQNVPVYDFILYSYLPTQWQFLNYPNDALIPGDFASLCGGISLLGGVGRQGYLSMTLNDLPPYRRIRLKFKTIIIDQGNGELLYFIIKGVRFQEIPRDWKLQGQNLCGDLRPDYLYSFDKTIPATGQLTITIHNSNNVESYFGIYDFSLQYQICSDIIRCATCNDDGCLTCSFPARIQSPQCLCPTYEYMNYAECPTCPYKCQGNQCNLQGCIVCADASRGYPPDCLCSTYEIYGEPTCPPCQLNCLQCTQSMCLQCQSGYFAYGEFCYLCPYQCETCLYNGCLTCSDPQRGPAPFCRCNTYEIQGQKQCPQCQQNCQSCDENGCLICVQPRELPFCDCPSNYYEIDDICIECDLNCKTCNQYQCLTCPRNDLILPYCVCPVGYQNINGQCVQGVTIIESLGYFNQQLTQVIIELNKEFFIIGLDNILNLNQENCVLIKNAQGLCQIQNQKIIYQFDSQLQMNLGDEIQFNQQFFGFLNSGQYQMSPFYIGLSNYIDYRPVFDLVYPNLILVCKSYIIQISNVIYIGNQDYQIQILNDGDLQTSIINKQVQITSLRSGKIRLNVIITNFVGFIQTKTIIMESNEDLQIDFEILPQLGQINRFFNLIVQINQIIVHNCVQNLINQPITKVIDINFQDQYIAKSITNNQQISFNINLGSLNVGQIYQLNVTATYQNYTKTQLTNYTINQVKPFFSILGGNRMIYYKNRLNISAIIVDPDTQGLICSWKCVILDSNQDCGFNFTSKIYQIIENYQLLLFRSYQFIYSCLGIEVKAIYNIVDINQDQLFIFYPAFYSTYEINQLYPVQYIVFNETNNNLLKPIILDQINIKIIQNFSISLISLQINSYGQQDLFNQTGSFIIQAQIDSMISSFNFNLKNISLDINLNIEPQQGIYMQDKFKIFYQNFSQINQPYLFRYLAQINDNYTFIISDWSIYQEQQFFLPQGDITQNYSVKIIGQIIDKFGYIYNKTSSVYAQPSQMNPISQLIELFQDKENYYQNMLILGYQYLQIQQNGCYKNCSNQGQCINNECTCQDFYLLDCSANLKQFEQLMKFIQQLLYDLINTTTIDSQFGELTVHLISNKYVYDNLQSKYILQLTNLVIQTMYENIFEDQYIQINDIDLFVESLQNPQGIINRLKSINLYQTLIGLVDLSFGLILNNKQLQNESLQNDYLMKLINITKLFAYYQGTQLYQDQIPYQIELSNIQITAYRVSNNYSQIFFNNPKQLQNQINLFGDQQIIQLRNDSIIGMVIFKNNPYIYDEEYPYANQNNQVASIQIYDKGTVYRSFQPLTVQLKEENISNNSNVVCIGQKNGKWISQICQTIKITNSNKTSCQCDTLDQSSVVNDVNNLYSNSKIYTLTNYYQLLNYQIYQNFLAYVLISFGICSIIFGYKGYKKDQMDYAIQVNLGIMQGNNQLNQNNQQSQLNYQPQNIKNKQIELNYDSEDEEIIIKFDLMRMKYRNLKHEILIGIQKLHQFIRINSEFIADQPRAARYIIFFLKQCILLSVTSIFGQGFSIIQNVFLGIISMILITPLEKLLMYGFNYQTKINKKIGLSAFIIIIYLICWYVCITVSLTVGTEQTNKWTLTFFISFLINQVIIEGFTIILKITFAPYLASIIFKGGQIIHKIMQIHCTNNLFISL
ncbi:hypothetical protein pb186bvf_001677 [Paramecium bursaria]